MHNNDLNKGSVSVTGNGVKTYSTLFTELANKIDYNKLGNKSTLSIGVGVCNLRLVSGSIADFYGVDYGGTITAIRISASDRNYTTISFSGTGTSYIYNSVVSNVVDNGTVIKVTY